MAAQPEVKEESLTDSYLYRLSRTVPTIRYRSYSRWEEARRTGADWEWWFLFHGRNLRLRVQAKKLRPEKSIRGDLARKNKHGGQLAMLIKSARSCSAIPMYVFFAGPSHCPTACGAVAGTAGAYVVPAFAIRSLVALRRSVNDTAALSRARPAACLACCFLLGSQQDAARQVAHWLSEFRDEQADVFSEDYGWHTTLPSYVVEVARGRDSERVLGGGERNGAPEDIQAVLTVDLRESVSREEATR